MQIVVLFVNLWIYFFSKNVLLGESIYIGIYRYDWFYCIQIF